MTEPTQEHTGWFIETDDGKSGPWASKSAANALGEGQTMKAQILHNRATKRNEGTK